MPDLDAERKLREQEFHDQVFADDGRQAVDKFYRIAHSSRNHYRDLVLRAATGGTALEYGCGPGNAAFHLARQGSKVIGIDISPVAIEKAEAKAREQGVDDRCEFHVMDAEDLKLPDRSVDVVCGSAILHHLDLERSYSQVARVLKPGGKGVFLEPMGHNPVINWYRNRTPEMRTPDEHPLMQSDLDLARRWFGRVSVRAFHLASLGVVPLAKMPAFGAVVSVADGFDRALFTMMPWLKKHAWTIVLELDEPIDS